jgi:hypothetical protein
MRTVGRRRASTVALGLILLGCPRCSNVSGQAPGSDAGPGCPANAADASAVDAADDSSDDGGESSPCKPPDSDGITGGCFAFDLTVDDTGFTPIILKAQNNAQVTLTLKNAGTKPHDLAQGCVALGSPGCPPQICFPQQANVRALGPGETVTVTFVTPFVEGIYDFRSDLPGDSQVAGDGGIGGLWGQFVLQ